MATKDYPCGSEVRDLAREDDRATNVKKVSAASTGKLSPNPPPPKTEGR